VIEGLDVNWLEVGAAPPAPLPAGFSEARLTNGLAVARDVIWQAQPWSE
jgi:hypothetical protein